MFNLGDAPEQQKSGINYLEPGVHDNLQVTDFEVKDVDVEGRKPYLIIKAKSPTGFARSRKMYLTTTKSEGAKMSAWEFTAILLRELIKATNGVTTEQANEMIKNVPSVDALVEKLSSILVGKPFRAAVEGEERNGRVYCEFKYVESMKIPREKTSLRVKPVTTSEPSVATPGTDGLPF